MCAAAIRALTSDPELHLRAGRLLRDERPLTPYAPHLVPDPERHGFVDYRGATDAMALRLAHSDAALHQRLAPGDPLRRTVFDLLEQFRVEALAPPALAGLRRNVRGRFEQWSRDYLASRLLETTRGRLLFALAQVCRARVCGEPMIEEAEDPIETTRGELLKVIGPELLAMRRARADQAAYAAHALALADKLAALWSLTGTESEHDEDVDRDASPRGFLMWLDPGPQGSQVMARADAGESRVLTDAGGGYRVFTRAYDRECGAAALVRPALLREYRDRLDARIAAQGVNVGRLAREIRALLSVPATDGWESAREDGRLDGRRLSQLIASATERRIFRAERESAAPDCLVTFLIDCSGSMKDSIETVAMLLDVLLRALEQAGVSTELLGFTTGAWNGGRAARDWTRAGRPDHPGRLNEAMHLVFKDADTPWRRARPGIAALLKADMFREGVDGEAVQWAARRMERRDESRRILLVVSDGSPMDTATHQANDRHYLDHHLRNVVQALERRGQVEIAGIGVGLDLSPYYTRSQAIDLAAPPGNRLFNEVLSLLAGRHRR